MDLVYSARAAGYRTMRVTVGYRQEAAIDLLASIGFREVQPLATVAAGLSPTMRTMRLTLSEARSLSARETRQAV